MKDKTKTNETKEEETKEGKLYEEKKEDTKIGEKKEGDEEKEAALGDEAEVVELDEMPKETVLKQNLFLEIKDFIKYITWEHSDA